MAAKVELKKAKTTGNPAWKGAPWHAAPRGTKHLPAPVVLTAPRSEKMEPTKRSLLQDRYPMSSLLHEARRSGDGRFAKFVAGALAVIFAALVVVTFFAVDVGTRWVADGSIAHGSHLHNSYCLVMRILKFTGRDVSDYEASSMCFNAH